MFQGTIWGIIDEKPLLGSVAPLEGHHLVEEVCQTIIPEFLDVIVVCLVVNGLSGGIKQFEGHSIGVLMGIDELEE